MMTNSGRTFCALFALTVFVTSSTSVSSQAMSESAMCDAIKNNQIIIIRHRDDPDSAELREIFPHGLGYSKKKNAFLLALQIKGYSKSGGLEESPMPGWRTFRLDRIRSAQLKGESFTAVRPAISRYKSIATFLCVTKSLEGLIP